MRLQRTLRSPVRREKKRKARRWRRQRQAFRALRNGELSN
jgi:hypothetical protein